MKRSMWLLVAVLFCGYSLFAALVSALFTRTSGLSMWSLEADATASFSYILSINLVVWGGWVLFAPAMVWLSRRFSIERGTWRRALVIHVAASLVVTSAHLVWTGTGRFLLQRTFGVDADWGPSVWDAFFRTLDFELPVYWAFAGILHAVDYYRRSHVRTVRSARLETRLAEAKLLALQQQLHPHFLFNTLHAVSSLVRRDPDGAELMIERLSDLLRQTLRSAKVHEIPLSEEIAYLRAYLDIEQVHFGDRLTVALEFDTAALNALVPTLILQPLVENAIRHGLELSTRRCTLTITGRVEDDALALSVIDNGIGLRDGGSGRPGIGLTNTRSRLQRLYGSDATLIVQNNPGGGAIARVKIQMAASTMAARIRSSPNCRPRAALQRGSRSFASRRLRVVSDQRRA